MANQSVAQCNSSAQSVQHFVSGKLAAFDVGSSVEVVYSWYIDNLGLVVSRKSTHAMSCWHADTRGHQCHVILAHC